MNNCRSYPLVSVAVITYNQMRYIQECLDSILAQDYPNIEIVIADDCSTDGTQELLKRYAVEHPHKIRLELAKENKGITTNANIGLFACTGQYIVMFAGDDCMKPGKIVKQVDFLESNLDFAICGTYVERIDEHSKSIDIKKDFKRKKSPRYRLCELVESGNSLVPVISYMFRKKDVPVGGYDSRLPTASDSLFFYHLASKGDIWIIPQVLTGYRVHESHARKLGYREDTFVARALAEYHFPSCLIAIMRQRARLYYAMGRSLSKDGHSELANEYYKASLLHKFSAKTVLAYIHSLVFGGK